MILSMRQSYLKFLLRLYINQGLILICQIYPRITCLLLFSFKDIMKYKTNTPIALQLILMGQKMVTGFDVYFKPGYQVMLPFFPLKLQQLV